MTKSDTHNPIPYDHWRVSVETSGDHIVSIEPNMLAGREPSDTDEIAIRTAAYHLLAFIGDPEPAPTEHVTVKPAAWLVRRYSNDGVLFDTELSFTRPVVTSTARTEFDPLYLPKAPTEHVLPPAVTGQMEVASDVSAADLGANAEPPPHTCDRCQGNGEIVMDWERYMHPHHGDVGDEAVAECPGCGGEGVIDAPAPTEQTQWPEEAIEAASMARTRLIDYANAVQRGEVQGGGREFERRIWGAFSDFDQACATKAPAPTEHVTGVIATFEAAHPDLYWHIGKGKLTADEPLYGAIITDAFNKEIGSGESDVSADEALIMAAADAGLDISALPATGPSPTEQVTGAELGADHFRDVTKMIIDPASAPHLRA